MILTNYPTGETRKERFVLVHNPRISSIMSGKPWGQELGATARIMSTVGKQRRVLLFGSASRFFVPSVILPCRMMGTHN